MDIIYKIFLISYMTIISIRNVRGDENYCNQTFNPSTCTYEIFCNSYLTLNFDFRYNENENEMDNMLPSLCKLIRVTNYNTNGIYYGGSVTVYPIKLTYKKTERDVAIPVTDYRSFLDLITNIDLSNNDYDDTPYLQKMENLAVLTLSQNLLTAAKLSNINEISSLTEINLSHNTISNIQYDSMQHIYKRLKKIDLSYNYLTKISEAVFDPFDELESLDVSHNYIDTLVPLTFEGTTTLLSFNISSNRISDINSSLFRFTELKLLDLSNNKIKNVKTVDFNALINLDTLNLSFNFISAIEINSFHNMPLLNNLYLNNNKLQNIDREFLYNLRNLVDIDLSENNFKALPKGLFKNKDIHIFSVKDNNLEGSVVKGIFEGLSFVTELDLSYQHLDSIDDYAFYGLNNISVLLLNGNEIRSLSSKGFRTIRTLKQLDLSFNKIENIEFEKDDLFNLNSLSLRNNDLTVVKQEDFHGLHFLQFLDLSGNKIAQVETNSFKSLKELINFQISNNPLSGTLRERTFEGLNSLPSLDISCTFLSTIQNGSFTGMIQLKNLNVSHSKINMLEYNIFVHTGVIESIDFSFNELKQFNINSTELVRLNTLNLNSNLLISLDAPTFKNILRLENLHLSNNFIQNIDPVIFSNMKELRVLDISYNSNLKITSSMLNKTKSVDVLNLSGIKTAISFINIKGMSLSKLTISNTSVTDVKLLQLNELQHLNTLSLTNNSISKLEDGGLYNISTLMNLDVSYNKILYIQPGVFRDNFMLHTLNISHNFLSEISYGIFSGLVFLQRLDVSYNNINDLQYERFHELSSLSVLIADHNKIKSINANEFLGTSLILLSIGGNPIPCEVLVNIDRSGVSFQITAIKLHENNDENFKGVTCNKKSHTLDKAFNNGIITSSDNVEILISIRDILQEHFNNHQITTSTNNADEKHVDISTDQNNKTISYISNQMSSFLNATAVVMSKNNETNILLDKILKVLRSNSATTPPPVRVTKDNATNENLITYINKVKQELEETLKFEKTSILNEVESKIVEVNSHMNHLLLPTEVSRHEKLTASVDSRSLFTETCTALILVILVGFILFRIYKSRVLGRQRFSVSTRELPGAMDSTL